MAELSRAWIGSDGARYEARLRRRPGKPGALTITRLPEGPTWTMEVDGSVSLTGLDTVELERLVEEAKDR